MNWDWRITLKGFAMGVADLVPGVSGGTIAFISGIYDPLLESLSALSGDGLGHLKRLHWKRAWEAINGPFLMALGLGIIMAIFTLAAPLHWLLANEPTLLRSFFMGLVVASIPLVGKHIQNWRTDTWLWALVGSAAAWWLTSLPPLVQTDHPMFLVLAGMVAICAMLLPGISGSFVLLILGAYAPVLHALKEHVWGSIASFGMGALFGLLAFSRALKWLLTNRRRQTLSLLTGFLAGSLQALWPWKIQVRELYTHSDGRVEWLLRNSWPHHWNVELWSAVGLFIIGATVVTLLQRWGDRSAGRLHQ